LLLAAAPAWAQFTLVTGTVTDPNGIPYAGGLITPALVISGTPTFTATHQPYTPPTQATGLSAAGSFIMQIADVTTLTPGGGTWSFTVTCGIGCVQPSGGKGSVSFTITGITISGSSQNISAQLQAAAPPLSTPTSGTFPTPATASFGGGVVTMTATNGTFPAAYVVGATISVASCSAGGDNSPPTFTIASGGAGTSALTYSDASGAAATGCIVSIVNPASNPSFGTVTAGTNPNPLLISGSLAPTGAGTIGANVLPSLLSTPFVGTNGIGTPIAAPCTGAQVLVGNGSSIGICQPLTGDSSITNTGVMKNSGLNSTPLGGLATGPLCNTTSTGIPFICLPPNFPTLNQNSSGTAGGLSGTPLLPNGTTAATQPHGDGSTDIATDAFVLANSAGAISTLSGAIKGLPLIGGPSGNANPSPIFVDATQFDATPLAPTTPCVDIVTAETNSVNGNFAVPTQGLGLSGTLLPCLVNPFGTSRNGAVYLPSGLLEMFSSGVLQSTTGTNVGPSNIIGTGHIGSGGGNGSGATFFQAQVGMALAQYGAVNISAANPAIVTGTPSTTQLQGATFNTSWKGLQFNVVTPSTGVINSSIITAVNCTTPANGMPCATTDTMTLTGLWGGSTGTTQNYFLSFPGTVTVSGANVTGVGTSFDASWVGVTINMGPLNTAGTLCGASTPCTVAAVGSGTTLTLNAAITGGPTCATACNYTLGTVYGPLLAVSGQANAPVTQGNSMAYLSEEGLTDLSPGGILNGLDCMDVFFGQEQTEINHIRMQDCGSSLLNVGGGAFFIESNASGPWDELELNTGSSFNSVALPVAATVNSVSSTALTDGGAVYIGQTAYAIFTFATVPVPMPARGQKAVCSGVTAGGAGTVYNGTWQVVDQVTPLSALVYISTAHANDGQATPAGVCRFYPTVAKFANDPFFRGRGMHNSTANTINFTYTGNKVDTFDGTAASPNYPSDFDFSGGAACNSGNLFGQGADASYVYAELGTLKGCNFYNLGGGVGTGNNTQAVDHYISNQFATPASSTLAQGNGSVGGYSNGCIFGAWGSSGNPTAPLNTFVDAFAVNTFPYGASGNGTPDIPLYCLDRWGFPALIIGPDPAAATPPTITNGFLSARSGLYLYEQNTVPVWKVDTTGGQTLGGHLNQTATGRFAGSCAMSTGTTCTFSIGATFTNYLSFASIDHISAPPATANVANCSLSGTTVTITAGISNSLTWDCMLVGNPN